MLLRVGGDARVRMRAADTMNFAEGALWSEGGAGTNAIGTALAAEHAVQVFAAEHFTEPVQRWTCAAAPVHDPDTGAVIGVIDLTGDMASVHPHSLAVAIATARPSRRILRCEMLDRDDAPALALRRPPRSATRPARRSSPAPAGIAAGPPGLARRRPARVPAGGGALDAPRARQAVAETVGDEDAYRRPRRRRPARRRRRPAAARAEPARRASGEAALDGETVALRPRHAEILALLCAAPRGLSAEELAPSSTATPGSPASVRVEMSRLRKLLGACIETEHYRLRPGSTADVAPVCGLLSAGGRARPRPPIPARCCRARGARRGARARGELEGWLRQAVMSAEDPEALWAWLQTTSGERRPGGLAAPARRTRVTPIRGAAWRSRALRRPPPRTAPCNAGVTPAAVPVLSTVPLAAGGGEERDHQVKASRARLSAPVAQPQPEHRWSVLRCRARGAAATGVRADEVAEVLGKSARPRITC